MILPLAPAFLPPAFRTSFPPLWKSRRSSTVDTFPIWKCINADDDASAPAKPSAPSNSRLPSTKDAPLKPQTRRRRLTTKKTTSFAAAIDNMTMKRMGRGTIYYGEKTTVDDDASTFLASEEEEEEELKSNSVLVVGATGQTGLWITLGLLTQGFNVRVLTRKFNRAETLFGPSGSNVDVFEGDVSNFEDVRAAVDGAVAIVYAASPSPAWFPPASTAVDVQGVQNIVSAASQSSTAIRRIVLISADGPSTIAQSKRRAEKIIRESSIPHVIVRAASLSDAEGGMRKIDMQPVLQSDSITGGSKGKNISRVDLAQCVCQALVQHRRIEKMAVEDPEAGFEFPNCSFSVSNLEEAYAPDKRFWINTFNRISDAFRMDEVNDKSQ